MRLSADALAGLALLLTRPLCQAGEFVAVGRAGELLRLDVRGHWFYPRDPVRGQLPTGYEKSGRGTCILHIGEDHGSRLLLPVRPLASS